MTMTPRDLRSFARFVLLEFADALCTNPNSAFPATRAAAMQVRQMPCLRCGGCFPLGDAEQASTRDASGPRFAASRMTERPAIFHLRQSASVFGGFPANRQCNVITAIFALDADALAQPPPPPVIKQQRFGGYLKQIEKGVKAADVRQFVAITAQICGSLSPLNALTGSNYHGRNIRQPPEHRDENDWIANGARDAKTVLHFKHSAKFHRPPGWRRDGRNRAIRKNHRRCAG